MGRKKKRKKQECVFCGKIAYTQSDHIPPENLFPKPRPSTLITVPSCPECHRKTTKDDEYFRLMIINREHVAKQPEAKKIIPKIKKSLQRSESRAFSTSFYNSLRTREAFTVNGIYLGNVITCLPNDARIQKVSNRIIKGLFYNLKKIRVPDECKIESCVIQGLIDEEETCEIRNAFKYLGMKPNVIAKGVFKYFYYFDQNSIDSTWLLVFYDVLEIIGRVKTIKR